jgi:hypothetical protein
MSTSAQVSVEHNAKDKVVKARCRHCDQEMSVLAWDMALALQALQELLDMYGWSTDYARNTVRAREQADDRSSERCARQRGSGESGARPAAHPVRHSAQAVDAAPGFIPDGAPRDDRVPARREPWHHAVVSRSGWSVEQDIGRLHVGSLATADYIATAAAPPWDLLPAQLQAMQRHADRLAAADPAEPLAHPGDQALERPAGCRIGAGYRRCAGRHGDSVAGRG